MLSSDKQNYKTDAVVIIDYTTEHIDLIIELLFGAFGITKLAITEKNNIFVINYL